VNTPIENSQKPEELNDLQAKIEILQAEKSKLETELKSREEMMSNLLSYIQSSK
jgi:chaperonin cofactor prefoldin